METAPTSAETLKPGPNPTNRLNRLEGSVESTEIWLPVPGYEGYYEVSDQGSVRGIERTIEYDGLVRRITSRVLRPNPRKDYGHLQVSLSRDGRSKTHLVHTLATEAFHGPRPFPQAVSRHLNGFESDNRAENLQWGTVTENNRDTRWHIKNRGEERVSDNPNRDRLVEMVSEQKSDLEIAVEFGVSDRTVLRWRKAEALPSGYKQRVPAHGTANRYIHHGCRCDECRIARADYRRSLRTNNERGEKP